MRFVKELANYTKYVLNNKLLFLDRDFCDLALNSLYCPYLCEIGDLNYVWLEHSCSR